MRLNKMTDAELRREIAFAASLDLQDEWQLNWLRRLMDENNRRDRAKREESANA